MKYHTSLPEGSWCSYMNNNNNNNKQIVWPKPTRHKSYDNERVNTAARYNHSKFVNI